MRLIDADVLIKTYQLLCSKITCVECPMHNGDGNKCELQLWIENAPTIDAVSVVRGEWIDKGWHGDWQFEIDGRGNCWKEFECSNCNCRVKYITPFCPQCGARMDGGKDQ